MAQKFTVPLTVKQLSSSGSDAITVFVDADTFARLKIEAGGRLTWGSGSGAGDVNLYRDGADVLKTDDTFKASALFVDGIEIDTTGATTDQVLAYNGTKFVPVTGGGGGGATNLDGLTDVVIVSPEEFQSLSYNGTSWVNGHIPVVSYVRNAESTTLTTGTAVYLFGSTGDHASVKRADNDSDTTSSKVLGLVAADIAASQNGPVVTRGYVDGIDLSVGYTAGDILWLGEDGGFTTTKPSAPEHLVFIGVVVRATNNGIIYVATQNGYELEELHDVDINTGTLASGDFLKYNGTLWVNDPINLGTDTVGDYVASLVAGTGITLANNSGEGATPTISIGQAVGTASSVTFGSLIVPTIGQNGNNIDINATNVTINTGANLYDDNGTVTIGGSLSVSGTINGVLSVGTRAIIFEGDTADAYETEIYAAEPTADRTITFPDKTGTVALDGTVAIGVSDTAPSSPSTGQLWYESDTGATFVYTGSAWIEVGATQGPYVCTSTTRPSSPYEGQLIYETDTDRILVYNSSAWVMMVAAGAPPGLQLIKTQTFTAQSTQQFTSIFTSDYANYRCSLDLTASTGTNFYIRFLVGTTVQTGNILCTNSYNQLSAASITKQTRSDQYGLIGAAFATYASNYIIEWMNPQVADYTSYYANGVAGRSNTDSDFNQTFARNIATTQIDGFEITTAGAPTLTGTLRVYGYRNSI